MIKNDAQMESKSIQTPPKLWSKIDAKIDAEINAKRHPQKGGSAAGAVSPLVVFSRHTLYLFLSIIFSTTNQTLKTARRHRYADARPDLKATASAADPYGMEVAWEEVYFVKCSDE